MRHPGWPPEQTQFAKLVEEGGGGRGNPSITDRHAQYRFAAAFHLRVLLHEYAFADVDVATRLRAVEPKPAPLKTPSQSR